MRTILLILAAPIFIIDHYLSYLRIYRWLWGGHWERWALGDPCHGWIWYRITRKRCYRMTGEHPGGIERGRPYCEERGRAAYDGAVYCKCGRDLSRAPGVYGSYEDESVYCYSCPCGRWPRFLFGPPAPIYIGDVKETGAGQET